MNQKDERDLYCDTMERIHHCSRTPWTRKTRDLVKELAMIKAHIKALEDRLLEDDHD
jgi:hypothetical protein